MEDELTVKELQRTAWKIAEDKGFHIGRVSARTDTLLRLCLVHTEVSEAAQEVKKYWTEPPTNMQIKDFMLELADVMIRVGDLAECVGGDLEESIRIKLAHNRLRPKQYGTPGEHSGI